MIHDTTLILLASSMQSLYEQTYISRQVTIIWFLTLRQIKIIKGIICYIILILVDQIVKSQGANRKLFITLFMAKSSIHLLLLYTALAISSY